MTRSSLPKSLLAVVASAVVVVATLVVPAAPAQAAGPCDPPINVIACENSLPGSPSSEWDVDGVGDESIQGFGTEISVNAGQRIDFKVKTDAAAYIVDIYRLGWYQGNGARKVATVNPSAALPQNQPACINDATTGLVDCGNWGLSASWQTLGNTVSGVYVAKLTRTDTGGDSHIPFIVRKDGNSSDVLFQTSDTTWQAYNTYGGSSFYVGPPAGRAYKLSYNRPFSTRSYEGGRDYLFANEYPLIRFLERNGHDVSYISGLDSDRYAAELLNHETYLSVGHDEYWSGDQRANVEEARDAGVNLAFLSGNEVYWKTRWEPSIDGSGTADRTLVCYKETWDNAKVDPSSEWTGTWRDPRFTPPSDGGRPENELTGTAYMSNFTDLAIQVSAEEGKRRLWRNSPAAAQSPGQVRTLAAHTVGYESDEVLDNGFSPAGLIRLSTTTGPTPQYLRDFGNTVTPGTTTHNLTMYRAPSGALVFGAGTVQWTWGLDQEHDGDGAAADPIIQQATVNLLADMGAPATTLMPGLVAASPSSDTIAPTATITSPAAGASFPNGTSVTVSGTAADGGGVVAGIEVSTDGGTRWHAATGTTSWSYTYVQQGNGPASIRVRATDDSSNTGAVVQVGTSTSCPCTMFGPTAPTTADSGDGDAVELGVRFTPSVAGFVTGVRFFKSAANTGTHTGSLWSSTGQLLANGTFTAESASGWQTLTFTGPIGVQAGVTYVASYYAPNGRYSADKWYFSAQGVTAPPLSAPRSIGGSANGVYKSGPGFPASTFGATNYWVDVVFDNRDTYAPAVLSTTPIAGASSVAAAAAPTAVLSEPVQPGSLQFSLTGPSGAVAGTVGYDNGTRTATFTPTQPLARGVTYTATVRATDLAGNQMPAPTTWTFRTMLPSPTPGVCPCGIWDDTAVPSQITVNDANILELGVKFTADSTGEVTGVRFYKGPQNSGTHTGSLWSESGQQLATATFTNESSTGWQTVTFAPPVSITAGTTYIASYRTNIGYYSVTTNAFTSVGVTNPPLSVPASGGVYRYGGGFPNSTSTSNYWVDVVYTVPPSVLPEVTRLDPADDSTSVPTGTQVRASFSIPIQPGSASIQVAGPGGSVSGSTSYDSATRTAVFTPGSALTASTTYAVTVSGARNLGGSPMTAPYVAEFRTSGTAACPCTLFASSALPATIDSGDGSVLSLGVKFVPSVDGFVTGARFYKASANVGTHTASLWSATGTRLATATFGAETASGWQSVSFSQPVDVVGGTTYVVSYFAPQGHYSVNSGFFANSWTNQPLSAPAGSAGNGLFTYGADAFPTSTFGNANYWVDPIFQVGQAPDATPPSVNSRAPLPGSTSQSSASAPFATFSEPIQPASLQMTVTGSGGASVVGTVAYETGARRATFTPSADLPRGVTYAVSVRATDVAGNAMGASDTWTFRTAKPTPAPGVCPCGLWDDAATPQNLTVQDVNSAELGVRFSSDVDGFVTGVRFYKGPQNTGTHTGSLWTSTGTLLGSAMFTSESTTGWQSVSFATPISVTAGTVYVASYRAPNGFYSVDPSGFVAAGRDAAPLHAPQGGAVYGYAAGFPANSSSSNYWVDPVFTATPPPAPDTTAPAITGVTATGSGTSATVVWTTDEPSTSSVAYGISPSALTSTASSPGNVTTHSVALTGLAPNTRYYFLVSSADVAGNAGSAPSAAAPAQYAPPVQPIIHTTTAQFNGTVTSTYRAAVGDGQLILAPALVNEFSGTTVGSGWTSSALVTSGSTVVANGRATLAGSRVSGNSTWSGGRAIHVAATLGGNGERVGWGLTNNSYVYAWFTVDSSGRLVATTRSGLFTSAVTQVVAGSYLGSARTYTVERSGGSAIFRVDGATVATLAFSSSASVQPILSDPGLGGGDLGVDWARITAYAASGTYASAVLDMGAVVGWEAMSWAAGVPAGTGLTVQVRTGPTATVGAGWTGWSTISTSGTNLNRSARYLQYQIVMSSSGARTQTPALDAVQLTYRVL